MLGCAPSASSRILAAPQLLPLAHSRSTLLTNTKQLHIATQHSAVLSSPTIDRTFVFPFQIAKEAATQSKA